MNLYNRKQRWKIALLGAAVLLVVASIWFSYRIVNKVQQREVDRIQQWADNVKRKSELVNLTNKAFDELSQGLNAIKERDLKIARIWAMTIEEINQPMDDYSFVVKILGEVARLPMILTDGDENIVADYNLGNLDSALARMIRTQYESEKREFKDSLKRVARNDSLQSYIDFWRTLNEPIATELFQGEKQYMFYFDSAYFRNERLAKLKHSRDSLVDAFSSELVTNEYLVPVLFIKSDTRELISTNMEEFDSLQGIISDSLVGRFNDSIMVDLGSGHGGVIYFEHSPELTQMKYFPFIQFFMIGLFILIAYLVFSTFRKAEQDQVWVGMAKETAHQLGTPISSLMAWNELLVAQGVGNNVTDEIAKDIDRLNTVTNRFSKIGSEAVLEELDVTEIVRGSVEYLRRRISSRIDLQFISDAEGLKVNMNAALMEWVIENIVKNAVDAMEGEGTIKVWVHPMEQDVMIDISDTGKGIPANKIKTVFQPGYTTKKRGWGLGLSLVKRIVEDFHRSKVFVLKSEQGVGTTFRIMLSRA